MNLIHMLMTNQRVSTMMMICDNEDDTDKLHSKDFAECKDNQEGSTMRNIEDELLINSISYLLI
jgi:hypothetical protein